VRMVTIVSFAYIVSGFDVASLAQQQLDHC
jgi:hypothetical protein